VADFYERVYEPSGSGTTELVLMNIRNFRD
jgi:hypothetical protein